MRKSALRGLLALTLGIGLLAGPVVPSAAAKSCIDQEERSETLYLDLRTDRHRYRIGDVAYVTARVSRTPFDSDLPRVPVEDVEIYVYLKVGRDYLFTWGETDVRGAVSMPVQIKRGVSPGPADANAWAHKTLRDHHCLIVEERGDIQIPRFLRILA